MRKPSLSRRGAKILANAQEERLARFPAPLGEIAAPPLPSRSRPRRCYAETVNHLFNCGIRATIRKDVVNSSNCSQGRSQAMALYEPGLPGISLTSTLASRKRILGLRLLARLADGVDVVGDPAVQLVLAVRGLHERADLVAGHHLQVVGEPRGGHDVRQPGRDGRVGRGLGPVVLLRLLRGLAAEEHGVVGVLVVAQRAGSRACSVRPRGGR